MSPVDRLDIAHIKARDECVMLTLFKSLVPPRLEYGCQLWSFTSVNQSNAIENLQRKFTEHITGMHSLSYENRLKCLNFYSLQRRRDRYTAIYVWKIMEQIVPNLSPPMCLNEEVVCVY